MDRMSSKYDLWINVLQLSIQNIIARSPFYPLSTTHIQVNNQQSTMAFEMPNPI